MSVGRVALTAVPQQKLRRGSVGDGGRMSPPRIRHGRLDHGIRDPHLQQSRLGVLRDPMDPHGVVALCHVETILALERDLWRNAVELCRGRTNDGRSQDGNGTQSHGSCIQKTLILSEFTVPRADAPRGGTRPAVPTRPDLHDSPSSIAPTNTNFATRYSLFTTLTDRVGFEPTERFPVHALSRRVPSATRPPVLVRIT